MCSRNDENRPSMNSVVLMLTDTSISMSAPSTPAFMNPNSATAMQSEASASSSSSNYNNSDRFIRNEVTISTLDPR